MNRRALALTATAAALLAVAGLWLGQRERPAPARGAPPPSALAIVPPGPVFVASIDLARLRASAAGRALLARASGQLSPDSCEQPIVAGIDELVLAVPAETTLDQGAFAVIAAGHFRASDVTACAELRVRARGGDPARTAIGSFTSVRDRRRAGEVATRDGLLVLSDGTYLRELLDAADARRAAGSDAERARDQLHGELRRVFVRGAPLSATLVLPPDWLVRALGEAAAARSPLALVSSAALRAELTDQVAVSALLGCGTPDACGRLEQFLNATRSDVSSHATPELALALTHLTLQREAARIELSVTLSADELAKLGAALH